MTDGAAPRRFIRIISIIAIIMGVLFVVIGITVAKADAIEVNYKQRRRDHAGCADGLTGCSLCPMFNSSWLAQSESDSLPPQMVVFAIGIIVGTVPEALLVTVTVSLALSAKRM